MAVVEFDPVVTQELRQHRRTFVAFERIVQFAAMHIALVLVCLALAFIGNVPWIGFLLGIGGTIALIAWFATGESKMGT